MLSILFEPSRTGNERWGKKDVERQGGGGGIEIKISSRGKMDDI
jgi:hypothetical protein